MAVGQNLVGIESDVHWGYDLDFDPWPNGRIPSFRKKLRAALKSLTKTWERELQEQQSAQSLGSRNAVSLESTTMDVGSAKG